MIKALLRVMVDAAKLLYKWWMKIARLIGWINTHLLLIIIFYLVFTPIGVIIKLFGRDLLDIKLEKEAASYWKKIEGGPFGLERYEKQY